MIFCLVNQKNGLLHGKYLEWNYDQYLVIDGFFSLGEEDGEWKFYDNDGCIMMVINFVNGEKKGLWKKFDQNGQIIEQRDYLNDSQYFDMEKNLIHQNNDLKQLLPDAEIHGFDISNYGISQAQEAIKGHLFLHSAQDKLPYENQYFDLIDQEEKFCLKIKLAHD